MSKYIINNIEGIFTIYSSEEAAFFAGYDFMGSVNWKKTPTKECMLTAEDDPWQIVKDLEAADDPEYPADAQYLLRSVMDDEVFHNVLTGREIADRYETDQIAGIYNSMTVWKLDGDEPQKIRILDLVNPILENKRWMEQEYRDNCDAVNEYGYDYEGVN